MTAAAPDKSGSDRTTVERVTVRVELAERSYDIEIGDGNLADAGRFLTSRHKTSHAVLITDANVVEPHAAAVERSLTAAGVRVHRIVCPAGESHKSVEQLATLWNEMLRCGADRKTVVVAVGGGVIGDMAGFVAASFARGLRFFQIPTTLLAHVDSSVGGKVGVNLPGAKNMVGAFWQPSGVLIDTRVLDTLPDREYRAGLAEVVKYGVILDAAFFDRLEKSVPLIETRDPATLRDIVARCCQLKADVVRQDEREETGVRAVLNYGHTFCHAIEAVAGYEAFLHGEAVSIGMVCASRLADRLGRIPTEMTQRQRELLERLKLPVKVPALSHDALVAAMQRDKKVEHGRLRFVLPTRMGHVELVAGIEEPLVREVLAELS